MLILAIEGLIQCKTMSLTAVLFTIIRLTGLYEKSVAGSAASHIGEMILKFDVHREEFRVLLAGCFHLHHFGYHKP
jgi:hypothetical protein